jgi:hypothetical protein
LTARSPKPRREPERSLFREIGAGVRFVFGNRLLRAIVTSTAIINLFHPIGFAVYILLLARTLHLSPALIGLIAAVASVGALLAAMSASRLAARFGSGGRSWCRCCCAAQPRSSSRSSNGTGRCWC